MKISGLQKTTVLDLPEKVACTVFTAGCNFRCPFCHNASLALGKNQDEVSMEEFFEFLNKRKGVLDGVCITGGEPLLQEGIEQFIQQIKSMGLLVKLDTNGSKPKLLNQLLQKNLLDYVAMDIKNSPSKYPLSIGLQSDADTALNSTSKDFPCAKNTTFDISLINQSIEILMNSNIDYEFRTTVVKHLHTKEDLLEIAKWISAARLFVLQKFRQSDDIICGSGLSAHNDDEISDFAESIRHLVKKLVIR